MRIQKVAAVLVVLAIGLSLTVIAQEQESQVQPPDSEQQPVFRGGIDAVSVDVTVTDEDGQPVTDLTADDFEIREEGELQSVSTFRLIETGDGTDATAAREILSLDQERTEAARLDNRIFVVFLDDYHVRRGNSMRVRQQLSDFLRTLTRNDLVAIATPLGGVSALTFSRNHNLTSSTVMGFEGRKYDYTPRHPIEYRYQNLPVEQQEQMRNSLSITALQSLCAYLGTLREGRKTIVYVSEGMSGSVPSGVRTTGTWEGSAPLSRPDSPFQDSMDFFDNAGLLADLESRVFRPAARNNVSIYSLDPRGLSNFEFGVEENVSAETDRRILRESSDLLRVIAERTDGRAIVANNDPGPALRQMVRDAGTYYLLGYTSTRSPRDGRFHEIEVRVNRPGVEVRARRGYWALTAEEVERATRPPRPELAPEVTDALGGLRATDRVARSRAVSVWLGADRGEAGQPRVTFAWQPAGGSGAESGERVDHVAIVATTADGTEVFRGEAPATGEEGGVLRFDAPSGALHVRVTPETAADRQIDNDTATIDVPAFTAPGPTLTTAFVYRARTARDVQRIREEADPLPVVTPSFSRLERVLVRFGAYGANGTTPDLSMRLLNQLGDEIAVLPAPRVAEPPGTFEAELAFGSFPPGEYLIEIAAAGGGETARQLVAIRIGG